MNRKRIDLWKLEPNWKFATQHGQASKPGTQGSLNSQSRRNSILMCPCCLKIIHKQPVSLFQNPKQLSFLGYGFPLFYNMLLYCLVSLFILIISQSCVLLYLSIKQACLSNQSRLLLQNQKDLTYPCQSFFVKLARVSINPNQFQLDRIIRGLSFIAQAFLLIYLRDVQRKLASYHDERNTRIKDFSVIFRNLPKLGGTQRNIRQFFLSLNVGIPLKIQEIFLMPKIDYFHELQQQKKQIIEHLKKLIKDENKSVSLKKSLEDQLQRVNLELIETCKKIEEHYQKDEVFSQKAIVILQSKEQKKLVLQKFPFIPIKEKEKYFFWMADQVSLQSAPEPRQIIWSHINYPKYKRWLRTLLGWFLSIIFLGATTGVFYFLVSFKAQSHSMTLLIITLILIQFFNKYIMKIFLHWFSDIQMPQTSSERQFSYACKYAVGMFFTTGIMTLLVEAVIYDNVYFQFGVVEGQTIMFFFNAFIVNLLWIIHPQYYIRKVQRWYYYGKKNITQKQANNIMQDYPYDMGKRYAQVLQTMWFTFLYSSIIPFGSFLSFIGLCIYYWIDKYNLLRRSKVQNIIQSKLPLKAVKLMQLTLFWKPLGSLVFDIKLRQTIYPQTYAMIAASIVFMLLPWDLILDKFLSQKFNLSKQTYQQAKYRFTETYQTVDPIQRMLALQKFIQSQNKARKINIEKDSHHSHMHSILQIRQYEDQKQEKQAARQMTREQIPPHQDLSIKIFKSESFQTSLRDES